MGRLTAVLGLLLVAPLLAGCYGYAEPLNVQMRVTGDAVISGDEHVNGTLVVERGATLRLENARLQVAQTLQVAGRLEAVGSVIVFEGPYVRQNLESSGDVVLRDTRIESVHDVQVMDGRLWMLGGAVDARCVRALGGEVRTQGADWHVGGPGCDHLDWGGWDNVPQTAVDVGGGEFVVENGTLRVEGAQAGARLLGGTLRLWNATLDATGAPVMLLGMGGDLDARGATLLASDWQRSIEMHDGRARLLDTPLPRNAYPVVDGSARFELAWTLTVRAVGPTGQPVPGVNVTLTGAHDPTAVESAGVTDEHGEARLEAVQYVWSGAWSGSRSGNPHVVHALGANGTGASVGVVVEAPGTTVLPVAPVGMASAPPLPRPAPSLLPARG